MRSWKFPRQFSVLVRGGSCRTLLVSAGLILSSANTFAQKSPASPPTRGTVPVSTNTGNNAGYVSPERAGFYPIDDGTGNELENSRKRKLMEQFAVDRHRKLVSDTRKLVQLTEDLKATCSDLDPKSVTLTEMKKVKEIEKLAKRVKENMNVQ